jgi:peptide/nickel transport system ATP-binding protein
VPGSRIIAIPGMPPDLAQLPPGCAFAPRCGRHTAACDAARPELKTFSGGRGAACIHVAE